MTNAINATMRPIADLVPYGKNARTHSDAQIAEIAGSIQAFGFNAPVLINAKGGIIAGHGRVAAARKLGMTEIPCIVLDHLSERDQRAYILADNRIALNAGWDAEMLSLELADLKELDVDLPSLGFDTDEMNAILQSEDIPDFEPASADEQGRLDEKATVCCPECGHVFTP
jgi:ParB-like chromosome segregation protein Spo0J